MRSLPEKGVPKKDAPLAIMAATDAQRAEMNAQKAELQAMVDREASYQKGEAERKELIASKSRGKALAEKIQAQKQADLAAPAQGPGPHFTPRRQSGAAVAMNMATDALKSAAAIGSSLAGAGAAAVASTAERVKTNAANSMVAKSAGLARDAVYSALSPKEKAEQEKFMQAVEVGDLSSMGKMIGANPALVNIRDENYNTPLHIAALNGQRDAAVFLVDKGADIYAKNYNEQDSYDAKEAKTNKLLGTPYEVALANRNSALGDLAGYKDSKDVAEYLQTRQEKLKAANVILKALKDNKENQTAGSIKTVYNQIAPVIQGIVDQEEILKNKSSTALDKLAANKKIIELSARSLEILDNNPKEMAIITERVGMTAEEFKNNRQEGLERASLDVANLEEAATVKLQSLARGTQARAQVDRIRTQGEIDKLQMAIQSAAFDKGFFDKAFAEKDVKDRPKLQKMITHFATAYEQEMLNNPGKVIDIEKLKAEAKASLSGKNKLGSGVAGLISKLRETDAQMFDRIVQNFEKGNTPLDKMLPTKTKSTSIERGQ